MEYNSFYGGRRGASFVIVEKFKSIQEMINAFKQGGNYKTVNYDEYIIIDTENKNNQDNGKIYRRGYDYNNDIGGAIYEGQIVGPSGPAPKVEFSTFDEIDTLNIPNESEVINSEGSVELIPGKDGNNYNDSIKYKAVSIRTKNADDSKVVIGFKVPYTVFDFTTESVEPYNTDGDYIDTSAIIHDKNENHPFYEKWNIKIPKGIKGNSIENLRIEKVNGKDRLMYDIRNFNNKRDGEITSIDLGSYNMIKNISLNDNGTLKIEYTYDDAVIYDKKIKWITKTEISPKGKIKITYNTGVTQELNEAIKWINNITMTETGQIQITYNIDTLNPENIGQPLNYIMRMAVSPDYHLLILHSDPAKRGNYSFDGRNDWQDMGSIKDYDGILIGKGFSTKDHPDLEHQSAAINFFNSEYPNGLNGDNLTGKVISVTIESENTSLLYAFDYSTDETTSRYKGWYCLGDISGGNNSGAIAGKESDTNIQDLAARLPENSLWFIIEE